MLLAEIKEDLTAENRKALRRVPQRSLSFIGSAVLCVFSSNFAF